MARHLVGFCGTSGSGKTTLIEGLIGVLRARGLSVSVIKHAHHRGIDIDRPGKDSWRHREAGAHEVLLASPRLLALQRASTVDVERPLDELLGLLQPVDWVLVEGYSGSPIPRIEVWRAATGVPPVALDDPRLLALATDDAAALAQPCAVPCLPLSTPQAVADWLLAQRDRLEIAPRAGLRPARPPWGLRKLGAALRFLKMPR